MAALVAGPRPPAGPQTRSTVQWSIDRWFRVINRWPTQFNVCRQVPVPIPTPAMVAGKPPRKPYEMMNTSYGSR